MANSKKTGTRYDKFTPASIEAAKKSATGLGLYLNYQTSFCCKCQKEKPKQGFSKRLSLLICADCSESLESAVLGRIDRGRYHTDLIELKAAFGAFDEQRSAK